MLLTAGLATSAQADELSTNWESGADLITSSADDTFKVDSETTVGSITIQSGHSLTTSGSIISNGDMTASGDLKIESGSILLAEKEQVGEDTDQTVYRHNFTSNGGDITMTGNIGAASFSLSNGTLVLSSGGEGDTNLTAYGSGWKQGDTNGSQSAADYDRNTANGILSNMDVTVKAETNVSALNLLTIEQSKITLSGSSSGTLTVNGESGDMSAYLQGSKQIKISDSEITVDGNNNTIVSANGQISDSKITVNSGGKLLITGAHSHGLASYNLTNTAITNEGELILGETSAQGSDSFTFLGGSMSNTGTVIINAAELSVTDEYFNGLFTKGTDSTQGKLNFSGSAINVDGSVDLNGLGIIGNDGALTENFTLEGSATLTADTINLDSAYKADKLVLDTGTLNIDAGEDKKFIFSSGTITVRDVLNGAAATDRVVIKAEAGGSSATLNLTAAEQGKVINIDRFNVGWTSKASGTSTLKVDGTWDFGGARVTASNNGKVNFDGTVSNVSDLMLEKNGAVTVNGNLTIERLLAGEDNNSGSSLVLNGKLTVVGDNREGGDKGVNNYYNDVSLTKSTVTINNGGTFALVGSDTLDDFLSVTKDASGSITGVSVITSGGKTTDNGGWVKDNVTLNAGGTLQINLADIGLTQLSSTDLKTFKESLVKDGFKGSFNFGDGFKVELSQDVQDAITNEDGTLDYSALEKNGINDIQGVADGATVTVDSGSAASGINLSNGASAVKLDAGTDSVTVDGSLILAGNSGNFVYSEDASGVQTVADVSVKDNSGVNLTGEGTVGALTKVSGATGTSAVLNAGQGATQTVQGTIDLAEVTIGTGTVNVTQSVTAWYSERWCYHLLW